MKNCFNLSFRVPLFATVLFFQLLLFSFSSFSQNKIDTSAIRADLKSMKEDSLLNDIRGLLDSADQAKNFFMVNASVTNQLFSAKNTAFNFQQTNSAVNGFVPSVSYFHKSGFGMSATAYLAKQNAQTSIYQTALTPSFDRIGEKSMYGISYTYYLKTNTANSLATPYNHDVYAYYMYRKTWIRPSIALGYATGNYLDATTIPIRIGGNTFFVKDTSRITLNDVSMIGTLSHAFSFSDVFVSDDMLTFTPQISLVAGAQKYSIESISIGLPRLRNDLDRQNDFERIIKRYKIDSEDVQYQYSLQTFSLSGSLSWYKDVFSLSGGYNWVHYLGQSTSSNTTAHIFNVSIGFTF
ncbi:MAG: hypothetical protein RL131_231 [Bacteroidota bacterium]